MVGVVETTLTTQNVLAKFKTSNLNFNWIFIILYSIRFSIYLKPFPLKIELYIESKLYLSNEGH